MAPSRRKSAGKAAAAAAAARKWKVGDLVLAKVKGFPAWPAMVSEPEKWGYSADRKKVMVYFFGTQQIAFCNPADVQAFTEEKKHSLLTKRHGKGSDFFRALKEIIESYEKLKNQEQADDQKSANDVTTESGRRSAESFQVRENQLVASLDTHLDSDISKGGDEHTLFSEDASAAEQMLALSGNNTSLEQLGDSLILKEIPTIATYSSRRRRGGLRSQKCPQLKKAPSLQQSKSLSRVDVHSFQSSMFVGGLDLDDMDEGAVRSRKQTRRPSGTPESDDVGLLTSNSNGSGDEDASEIATVESDNSNLNGSAVMDSISRSEDSTKAVVRLEGELELKKGCDIQIKGVVVKKKRKPKRKRGSSYAADPPAKVNVVADMDTGMSATCHISQNSLEDLRERPSKENGDEHLPLVKRARVRMSRTYADDEVNTLQVEERLSTDTVINELSQAMPLPNHDNKPLPDCQSYVSNEPLQICLEGFARSSGDFADVLLVADQRSSGNPSPSEVIGNQFSNSQHDNPIEPEPLAKQFNSTLDDESAFSPPKHAVVKAVSAAVEEAQACSRALSTMNVLINEPDMSTAEGTHETDNTLTCLQLCGANSFANDASEFCVALNSSIPEEPAKKPCADESQKRSPGDNMVNSADCHDEKSYHHDSCILHSGVQFETRGHSPSTLSFAPMLENSEADDFQLRQGLGSLCKDLVTSNEISENPAQGESYVLLQHGEPQAAGKSICVSVEPLKPEYGDNSQQNDICKVIAITKDQVQAGNSVSVNDDHSCEKMNISPADLSGSPVRATPHSTSGCHISTAESANIVQSNGGCTPKEGEVTETGASQRQKFVGISSNYVEAQNSLQLFEGALGSLVRTKESIARATRLAMDCAKLGVSAKVMEIIANNLENETDLQRRVDSFFLVDSIAQCSRSLKGDSGVPYLSSIQSMLPRLLFAAAPPGATTQENRRQCLKVLKLWLERRILPEYVLCQHIKELDSHSSSLSACLYSRRSARTERALDDPVRDMEGMLVDEYGSNSTLQLSGLSMPSLLKDDEGSDSDGGGFEAVTPEHNLEIPEEHQDQLTASATERHTHILEEVDGELEMEDVAPTCDIAASTCNNFAQDDKLQTSQNQFCQEHTSFSGRLSQDASSVSPPLPTSPHRHSRLPPPPPCAVSDSYSNGVDHRGYPDAHCDHLGSESRINPPIATNRMPYPGPEPTSSYCNSRSRPNIPYDEGSNFQPWHHPPCPPHPPPPPPPSNHFPYMPPSSHHTKSRRDMHSYSHRSSHHMHDYDERHFNDNHARMRPGPYESRENRRYPPPYGPRYHDKPKGPYGQGSYGGPPREPPRFHNQRANHPPRPFNHQRNSFHYRHHSEGPVSVGMRDPDMWHERW